MNTTDFLSDLNEDQCKAVECTEGPVMVIAGPGSGKTRVLTYRIAHLLSNGADAFRILALTFTNKAAGEMKSRIEKLVGSAEAKNLWAGTFHSIFAKILRIEAEKIGYSQRFTIFDTVDSRHLIKSIIKENRFDDKVYGPDAIQHRISRMKNLLVLPEDYLKNEDIQQEDEIKGKPHTGLIYQLYNQRCKRSAVMDFDDLLVNTYLLLDRNKDALSKYQKKFSYILVDEFQDTNPVQYMIVRKMAGMHKNICVVGDDAQSIYAFRGATIRNILNFSNDYPDVKTFKLEKNYRSTQTIVQAANNIIGKNKEQITKHLWTSNDEGEKIKVFCALSDNEEGMFVANSIFETKNNLRLPNNCFAVFYRTNSQSRAHEEALRKYNIPYRVFGGISFYQRKEIKDLLAYFHLAINNHNEEALKRVINNPSRGIGDTSIDRLIVAANENNCSMWAIIDNLQNHPLSISQITLKKISDFVAMIKSFSAQINSKNAYDLAIEIASSSGMMKELYSDDSPEGVSRYENIQELLNGIKEFSSTKTIPAQLPIEVSKEKKNSSETRVPPLEEDFPPEADPAVLREGGASLTDFMNDIVLLTDADEEPESKDYVSLMTLHAAKGLEFPYVFITGMEENLFPSYYSVSTREEVEEERRLFYVGLTRAEKKLTLTHAQSRFRFGELVFNEPSRFLSEIDACYLDSPVPPITPGNGNLLRAIDNGFFKDSASTPPYVRRKTQKQTLKEPSSGGIPIAPISIGGMKKMKRIGVAGSARETGTNGGAAPVSPVNTGSQVEHHIFGKGKVVSVEGKEPNIKATIAFDNIGRKVLLLRFAKLKIVN